MERFYFPKRQHYLRKSNRMAFDIFDKLAYEGFGFSEQEYL